MSQKLTSDGAQKSFAVGRGLLAAAETLNFSMGESHSDSYSSSSQKLSGMVGLGGPDGQDHDSQLSRRMGSHYSNTMKLFASLGLSPNDLDVLAQVPEENISVETLPHLIMQLKNRKGEGSRHLANDLASPSPDTSYRGGRDDWGDMQGGRLDRSSGQSQSRASQGDFGYSSMQDVSSRGYDMLDYGSTSSSRDRQYSELSSDHYRGMSSSSASDDLFVQRRIGSPSQGKIQDFMGVMPIMFPHVCSLCDFDVHSSMEWNQHTSGMRHAENRRVLLQLYPDWDPQMPSGRMSGSLSLDSKSRSEGLLGAAPPSDMRQRTGMSSNWGSGSSLGMTSKMNSFSLTPKVRSRVVVVKYDRKPVLSNLFALTTMFGTVREHLVLKNKAFLEFHTHEEALAMANYYQKKPAVLHGKEVHVYLSKELIVIAKDRQDRDNRNIKGGTSPVVFFSNLPRDTEKKAELLVIARRFGTVEKHLFLNDEAFVQMSSTEDAEMLVKYYSLHSLTLGRRPIQLNICTKYKTLTVPPGKGDQVEIREDTVRKSSSSSSSSRTSYKTSSKTQRSASSKGSAEKTERSKPSVKKEVLSEGSGDDGEGVEAHDEEEEEFEEDTAAEETNVALEEEEAEAGEEEESPMEQADPEGNTEFEEPATDQTEGGAHDAEKSKMVEEEDGEQEEQAEPDADQDHENSTEEHKDTEHPDDMEEAEDDENASEDFGKEEGPGESDFPENMDEFVTLDELAEEEESERQDSKSKPKTGRSRESGGMRVVNVVGFKRGYSYLEEILALAKPFGKVVRHLVLDSRPEAFLELTDEKEAIAMVRFYNGNVIPSVCGKSVKVYHSQAYSTIQSGRVVYVGNVPPLKSSDEASFLKIADPYGKVRRYYYNKPRNECFIEMDKGEEAERFVKTAQENPPKFQGKRLIVYVSRKYKQLRHGHRPPSPEEEDKRSTKREHPDEEVESQSSSSAKANVMEEEPQIKKAKLEKPSTEKSESAPKEAKHKEKEKRDMPSESAPEVKKESTEVQIGDATEAENTELKPNDESDDCAATPAAPSASVPEKSQETDVEPTAPTQSAKKPETAITTLGPYEPNVPVGVEFVKMGYYCRVCFLFYSNEDTAKRVHCSSQAHYDKLKKHLEKEKTKAQSNGGKN